MIKRYSLDILLVTILGVLLPIITTAGSPILRTLLVMGIALFIPGYLLTQALLARNVVTPSAQLLTSIGLSLIVLILGGLVLNLLPLGLVRFQWEYLLEGVIIVAAIGAIIQRERNREDRPIAIPRFQLLPFIALAGIVVLTSIAFTIARQSAQTQARTMPAMTVLTLKPASANANSYVVEVEIDNHEHHDQQYTIQYTTDTFNNQYLNSETVTVKDNGTWSRSLQISLPVPTVNFNVSIFKSGAPQTVYRSVSLTLQRP